MNLRDLEYLIALTEERHFHRAAERCFVSQPTLSAQIKKLEQELGVTLVERNGRQIAITDVGEAVAEQARRVITEAKAVKQVARSYADPLAGDLAIGVIPTIAPYLLPLLIPQLRRRAPQLRLFLHEYQTAILLERLAWAELDLLILALPLEPHNFVERDLYREPFLLAVSEDDPLAQQPEAQLTDLDQREVLLLEEGHCLRGQALDICLQSGASEYGGFRASSLETLRQMVAEGIGITLMPALALHGRAAVRYLPFHAPVPNRRVGLLYRRASPRISAFNVIGEAINHCVAERLSIAQRHS